MSMEQDNARQNFSKNSDGDQPEMARIIDGATTIRKTGLQILDARFCTEQEDSINLWVKPGEICCITGNNREL